MAENQNQNPFSEDTPKIVHLEKSQSHYEYCRMQMHDIEKTHRRTFFANTILCILVCFLAIFQVYISGFGLLSKPLMGPTDPGAILTRGIFQILIAMVIIVLGYLAWANFHSLNIILELWYALVTFGGIIGLDYLSAVLGIVGVVFYFFSLREMRHEEALSEMDGYPDFQEKFDISKSDIVIQTLLAHQGEHRTKSTLFTTDYSLRRKKNSPVPFGLEPTSGSSSTDATSALAEVLQKQLDDARDGRQANTAIATLSAVTAAHNREKAEKEAEKAADKNTAGMTDLVPEEPVQETATKTAPETAAPVSAEDPDAIIAAAEEQAKRILAEAAAKAEALKAEAQKAAAEQTAPVTASTPETEAPAPEQTASDVKEPLPAKQPAKPQGNPQGGGGNRRRKKEKH